MKTKRIKLRDITADQLNTNCLRIMTQCALKLRSEHGIVLQLSHPKILTKLRRKIKKTQDENLAQLYQELKIQLKESLYENSGFKYIN